MTKYTVCSVRVYSHNTVISQIPLHKHGRISRLINITALLICSSFGLKTKKGTTLVKKHSCYFETQKYN
jgi:hypothetical protein